MDFAFAAPDEVASELGRRLKVLRLGQGLQQADLALRAGISVGTVKQLERSGQSTLISLIRVVQAMGLVDELQPLLSRQALSIADMERAQRPQRQRAPRKPRAMGAGS